MKFERKNKGIVIVKKVKILFIFKVNLRIER
jgi:hypothetical protein